MLTVGEHDSMWKNVMGSCIPNITDNLRILANQIGHRNQLDVLKELHDGKIISDKDYYETVAKMGKAVSLLNEKECNGCIEEVKRLYKEEES